MASAVAGQNDATNLPDVVHDFPKSDAARAFPDLKIYDGAGRPWRAASEDWDGARQRVRTDPQWGQWLSRQRESVDQWMKRFPHDRVEWACGWWHDFVSPRDGSFITWTPDVPGEEVAFLQSPSDPHVEITPKIVAGWVYGFRGRHADKIREAAALYRLTGERVYADWAAEQMDFYAGHLAAWPTSTRGEGTRLYWQTLDEAVNLITYTEAVRLLGNDVPAGRRQTWKEKFFDPEADLLAATMLHIHNIATWHRCAEAVVALQFQEEARWKNALDGEWGLRRQLAAGITSDYIWYEQSFGYNSYGLTAMVTLFKGVGLAGRADELADEMATAENLSLSLLYLRFPDGRLPSPADGGRKSAPDTALLASEYRVFPTTLGLAAVAGQCNWDTLLDPPPPSPRPPAVPPARAENLESTRMAVLKSGSWQVFLHYGQLTASHAQAELPNFEASYGDTDITHDPGTVGYGSPLHGEYYTRGLNHNVPLIDGEGQDARPQAGVVDSFTESPAQVAVSLPGYRPDVSVSRTLRIDGDRLIDAATIRCTGGNPPPRKLGVALHLQGKVVLPETFQPDPGFGADRPKSFGYWTEARKAGYTDKAEFDVLCGARRMRVSIAVPGVFTVWHGSTPDSPPLRREGFYVETLAPAATFTTVFSPVETP